MSPDRLLTVEEALARVLATAPAPLAAEGAPLSAAHGRTLATDLLARRTHPPCPVSAMDGYAVRAGDIAAVPTTLTLIGTSQAGQGFAGTVGVGETVRIFTGAPVPDGADAVLMQEDATVDGTRIMVRQSETAGRSIRRAGLDFTAGECGLTAGRRLDAADLALAAAMNYPEVPVIRAPLVAILATGDELVPPGQEPGPAQIVASNSVAVAAIVTAAGGTVLDLGIAGDTFEALDRAIATARAAEADILVTLGGASVGDHDLVQAALRRAGMPLGFWKVALRPGKPLMHGVLGGMRVLGLPGNPVSSIVCGVLFVRPLIRALAGDPAPGLPLREPARLVAPLPANGDRQDYMRATLTLADGGLPRVAAATVQDSSMLKVLAGAKALIVRAPNAPPADAGASCEIIRLDRLL